MLTDLGDVQIALLAVMLLGGSVTKLGRAVRGHSIDAGLGPTALFPLRLRLWMAVVLCAVEFSLGAGLIATAFKAGEPAELVRLGTGLLFVVATCSLIELRSVRPDIGCGCFGDFSSTPITGRTLLRCALLAGAALGSVEVPAVTVPRTVAAALPVVLLLAAELGIFAVLSPEVRDLMVRVGYSTPCELRLVSPEQTLAVLQRSAQWRRHRDLIADQQPTDVWRELCWRYVAYASRYDERDAELVFAVYLQHHRPAVLSVLVDAATGAVLPWPGGSARARGSRWRAGRWVHRELEPAAASDL
jgi:hypothetical protein